MLSIQNTSHSSALAEPLKRLTRTSPSPSPSPTAMCLSPSLRFKPSSFKVSLAAPKGLGLRYISLDSRLPFNQSVVAFAASHEESKHSDVQREKDEAARKMGSQEEVNEAWRHLLETFKEVALMMLSVSQFSQVAFKIYTRKALIFLSEQFKLQAEKAKNGLTQRAKLISKEGKVYLLTEAKNFPPEIREIVETFFSSIDDFDDIDKVLDFHVGIPYGFFLSVWGFLSFMLTGSISAIRFGVILGGALLALGVLSLKSYRRGKSSPLATNGQAVIASVLFLRDFGLLVLRSTLGTFLSFLVSGVAAAFYVYKFLPKNKQGLEPDVLF